MVKIYCQYVDTIEFQAYIVPVLITQTFLITLIIFKKRLHFWFLRSTAPMGLFILFIYISIAIDKLQTALDCNYINQCTGYNLHKLYKLIYYSCSLYNTIFFALARIRFQHSKLLYRFTNLYTFREILPFLTIDSSVSLWLEGLPVPTSTSISNLLLCPPSRFCYFLRSWTFSWLDSFVCSVLLPLYRFRSWTFSWPPRTEQISSSLELRTWGDSTRYNKYLGYSLQVLGLSIVQIRNLGLLTGCHIYPG